MRDTEASERRWLAAVLSILLLDGLAAARIADTLSDITDSLALIATVLEVLSG